MIFFIICKLKMHKFYNLTYIQGYKARQSLAFIRVVPDVGGGANECDNIFMIRDLFTSPMTVMRGGFVSIFTTLFFSLFMWFNKGVAGSVRAF